MTITTSVGRLAGFAAAIGLTSCLWAPSASAVVTLYTDAGAWAAAVGGASWTEDFESFASDTEFRTGAVATTNFTLEQMGSGSFRNFIDVPSFLFTDNGGSDHASMFTDFGVTTVDMVFTDPVFAWGANFYEALTGELEDLDLMFEMGGSLEVIEVSVSTGFFGFVTDPAEDIGSITFQSRLDASGGEGFGLDDVRAARTVVPEPSSVMVLGLAVLGVGVVRYRRRRGL